MSTENTPESCRTCHQEGGHVKGCKQALLEVIETAMQGYWDAFCADTGCVPTEFEIRGPQTTRVYADFRQGEMAFMVCEAVLHFTSINREES